MNNDTKKSSVAVFIDVENIHYSIVNSYAETPDWSKIVEICKTKGRIASIQAFGDWIEFSSEVSSIQRNGIQPVFVPLSHDGKSSLDCYLTVTAMKLFFQNESVDTLILASGDRDYIPLIAELKALGKTVIILSVPDSLSKDLFQIADEVLFYKVEAPKNKPEEKQSNNISEIRDFIIENLKDLEQKSFNNRWVNLGTFGLKLKQKDPSFTHKNYRYGKFVEMLADIPGIELKFDGQDKNIALARTSPDNKSFSASTTLKGKIIKLVDGYGFIKPETKGENLFFHCSKLVNCHFDDLSPGDNITYTIFKTERGDNAENIMKI